MTSPRFYLLIGPLLVLTMTLVGCPDSMPDGNENANGNGNDNANGDEMPLVENGFGKLGDAMPRATAEQQETFDRGQQVALKRFNRSTGLGPAFNVVSCAACHERPTTGGTSTLYRSFFIGANITDDGVFVPTTSAGMAGGILRVYNFGPLLEDFDLADEFRPVVPETTTIFAQRNCIPFFGTGLIAELSDEEIMSRADPDDLDGDGISGRVNTETGDDDVAVVSRFGRKAQVSSIEAFIRGPLFNHMGITTDPLTEEQRAQLPVDSQLAEDSSAMRILVSDKDARNFQVGAMKGPNSDDDGVPDPEMTPEELFDLISWAMLLAAPQAEELTDQGRRGRDLFEDIGCATCHVPVMNGPRGGVPIFSDLLIHDMGEDLADGLQQGDATGSEFRTQPLWGIASVGPYLHDGRAQTLNTSILAHGGESQASRDLYAALTADQQADIDEFLQSLGGRDQFSTGLVPPNSPILEVGTYGGPRRALSDDEADRFLRGRELFDRDFGFETGVGGVGGKRFNGDSCRACHFDPVIGGSGPADVNVMRHAIINDAGQFVAPAVGTIFHKQTTDLALAALPQDGVNLFEHRQPPHNFGLGLMDLITRETIEANADPDDADGDGISGRISITNGDRVGRLGWKAQVPTVAEFTRDAMAAEIGLTVEPQFDENGEELTFGAINDNDTIEDPELSAAEAEDLTFFISMLAGPPRQDGADDADALAGEALFDTIGCTKCHIPSLVAEVDGEMMDVPLFSDILLHQILADGALGIEDTSASMQEFRTAPLWGLSQTAPYFHTGEADTIQDAIMLHEAEGAAARDAYNALSDEEKAQVLAFLGTL